MGKMRSEEQSDSEIPKTRTRKWKKPREKGDQMLHHIDRSLSSETNEINFLVSVFPPPLPPLGLVNYISRKSN